MAGPFAFGEAEVHTFTQRGGESLKDAWYRINDSQKRATKKQSTTILLRNFYVGITSWNRFILDTAINGNFLEAPVGGTVLHEHLWDRSPFVCPVRGWRVHE